MQMTLSLEENIFPTLRYKEGIAMRQEGETDTIYSRFITPR